MPGFEQNADIIPGKKAEIQEPFTPQEKAVVLSRHGSPSETLLDVSKSKMFDSHGELCYRSGKNE